MTSRMSGHGGSVASVRFGLVVTSDSVKRGEKVDEITPLVEKAVESHGHKLVYRAVVGNDMGEIQLAVLEAIVRRGAQVVIVTGGTGPRPLDVSVDAVERLAQRVLPGIGEEFRRRSLEQTSHALLSRAGAYIVHGRLVVVCPGKPAAVKLMLDILFPIVGHLVHELLR